MTEAADLILTNAAVHTLVDPDADDAADAEAVAIRDGEIVRVDSAYEIEFLNGVETEVIDLGGRVLLPGFIDAHVHMQTAGRSLVHADLGKANSPADCAELLRESMGEGDADEWVLGFGFDESTWAEGERRYPTREDLDAVSEERPVVAFREDMHVAAVNGIVLDRFGDEMPADDVRSEGEPTGVIVEAAVDVVYREIEPGPERTRELLLAAQREANEKGVTGVHDMVRNSHAPQVYRELDRAGELSLRVRLNYWSDHLAALEEAGLRTNHGSEFVRVGAIKTYTDGSFGGRTAKLSEPYADSEASTTDASGDRTRSDGEEETGQWVVPPAELRGLVREADEAGFQVTAHAIGDEAVEAVVSAYEEETDDPGAARHRVEHVELATDEHIERLAAAGIVASMQPNFLKWAGEGGLYDVRLGPERRVETNRFADLVAAGVPLAFGSDCMPLDPLLGIHQAVNPPAESQRLSVTDALRAYTFGAAYAGSDEDRVGTIEVGKKADLVAIERSPWEHPGDIENIDVALTIVDGNLVYDGR